MVAFMHNVLSPSLNELLMTSIQDHLRQTPINVHRLMARVLNKSRLSDVGQLAEAIGQQARTNRARLNDSLRSLAESDRLNHMTCVDKKNGDCMTLAPVLAMLLGEEVYEDFLSLEPFRHESSMSENRKELSLAAVKAVVAIIGTAYCGMMAVRALNDAGLPIAARCTIGFVAAAASALLMASTCSIVREFIQLGENYDLSVARLQVRQAIMCEFLMRFTTAIKEEIEIHQVPNVRYSRQWLATLLGQASNHPILNSKSIERLAWHYAEQLASHNGLVHASDRWRFRSSLEKETLPPILALTRAKLAGLLRSRYQVFSHPVSEGSTSGLSSGGMSSSAEPASLSVENSSISEPDHSDFIQRRVKHRRRKPHVDPVASSSSSTAVTARSPLQQPMFSEFIHCQDLHALKLTARQPFLKDQPLVLSTSSTPKKIYLNTHTNQAYVNVSMIVMPEKIYSAQLGPILRNIVLNSDSILPLHHRGSAGIKRINLHKTNTHIKDELKYTHKIKFKDAEFSSKRLFAKIVPIDDDKGHHALVCGEFVKHGRDL